MRTTFQILLLTLLVAAGCKREQLLELPNPTIEVLNFAGGAITQEAGRQVILDVRAQSVAGITNFVVEINGTPFETLQPTGALNFNYTLDYTLNASLAAGNVTTIKFIMEDQAQRRTESPVISVVIGSPFSIDDITLNGTRFSRIKGRINQSLTLDAATNWLIDSIVSVEDNAVLTVEPGTTVYFRTFTNPNELSLLSITRGSRIIANGTRTNPIVFTSDRVLSGNANAEDWGGLLLHGFAPTNEADVVVENGFRYGGNQPGDNSGTLRFVRIEYSGKGGFHGLHLFGVGAGTTVEYVEVYKALNIAFRVKGGRVSLKYLAAISHGGYAIWAENGWQGNGQFWLFQTDVAATLLPINFWNQARSIELRNDLTFFDKEPRTRFRISNVTLIGNGFTAGSNTGTRRGIRIRRGAIGTLQNAIVTEFPSDGVRVEDLPISDLGSNMVMENIRSFNNFLNYEQEARTFFLPNTSFGVNEQAVPGISRTRFDAIAPSPFNPSVLGPFFSPAPYIGAVDPANDWTRGGTWFKDINGNFRP